MSDQAISPGWAHFEELGERYDKERPGYPQSAVESILAQLSSRSPESKVVLDVGCGTGIFTRLLAERLKGKFEIRGIEPSFTMKQNAIKTWRDVGHIVFMSGSAEELPAASNSVALLTAAGSAQLFDRVRFYSEVDRVLVGNGLLAIIQNKRRHEKGFFHAFERLLEKYVPNYRTGTYADATGGHSVADFKGELSNDGRFDDVAVLRWEWSKAFTPEGFDYFASSTIQLKLACSAHGTKVVKDALWSVLEEHRNENGHIDAHFTTEVTSAGRRHRIS